MRGGRVIIIVGVMLFLGAVLVGILYLSGMLGGGAPKATPMPAYTPTPTTPPGVQIVVAAQNLKRGDPITADNNAVTTAFWPETSVPPNTLHDPQAAYNRAARTDIPIGMPITEGLLTDVGALSLIGSDAALMIPEGKVAYAFAVSGNSSVAWAIRPGDRVDVLISMLIVEIDEETQSDLPTQKLMCVMKVTDVGELIMECVEIPTGRIEYLANGAVTIEGPRFLQRPRLVTQMTVQNALVLHVGAWPLEQHEELERERKAAEEVAKAKPKPTPRATPQAEGEVAAAPTPTPEPTPRPYPLAQWVTVAVAPQEALVLKYAEETGASIDLALRSAHDKGFQVTTQAVTLQYLFEQYGITDPPKLPYGVSPTVVKLRLGGAGEVIKEETEDVEYSRWHWVTKEEKPQEE